MAGLGSAVLRHNRGTQRTNITRRTIQEMQHKRRNIVIVITQPIVVYKARTNDIEIELEKEN